MADTTELARSASTFLRQCRTTLGGMEHGLSSVMKGREQDFLALGESLMALRSGCEDISSMAGELVELSSGQAMLATLEGLSGQLRVLTDQEARDAGGQGLDDIDGVSRIVGELSGIVAAFAKIVKHLSMLGISTRIESARLGGDGRGFSTLADDVEKLAHAIVDHCAGIAAKIEALGGHVASARERTLAIGQAQRRCGDTISSQLDANLTSLGELSERSAGLSRDLSVTAGGIAADISKVVQSLQSHDIVRQQIEHVEHALAELAATLSGEGEAGDDPLELAGFAADMLGLQTSQLDSAGSYFSEAAATLRTSLDALSGRILGIGQAIASLPGRSGGAQNSPLARVEAGIASVKRELGDFAGQGEALGGIMDSVAATITDMGESIEAIEEVGEEIELIALNASIKAAHTGEAGAALGVLAKAIQHLSADARRLTDAVSRILGDISSASKGLQENAQRYNDQSEAWRVIGELDAALLDMADKVRRSDALFAHLSTSSVEFGNKARSVSAGIDFDRDLVGRLQGIRDTLEGQAGQARQIAPAGATERGTRLRALYDRYTMEAERAVHEEAFGLAPSRKPALPTADSSEAAGEFGDNVELF
ncbi:MAG: methyl-accepting chemotaxis protein [Desulfovibrionaceae bacterium]